MVELVTTTVRPLVVCVDDDEAILRLLKRALGSEPVELRTTLSPSAALDWIASEEVAVLISDYDMPEMTGAQLTGQARRIRPETVRVLLTAKRTLEVAVDGIHQGEIFRFLNKPFANADLRNVLAEAVARNAELLAVFGDRERRQRREALHAALENEYPGILQVDTGRDGVYELPSDPWSEAVELGLTAWSPALKVT